MNTDQITTGIESAFQKLIEPAKSGGMPVEAFTEHLALCLSKAPGGLAPENSSSEDLMTLLLATAEAIRTYAQQEHGLVLSDGNSNQN